MKKIIPVIIFIFVPLFLVSMILVVNASPSNLYTPPTQVTVSMYQLASEGYSLGVPCTSSSVKWGCTAFCNNVDQDGNHWDDCASGETKVYPYGSDNTPTLQIESDYLLDVVSHEAFPAVTSHVSVIADAIAARSFTYWHRKYNSTFNNSTDKHVFVPYRFERLNETVTLSNPSDVCASTNLNSAQRRVCNAMENRYYVSYGTGSTADDPAITQYFSDTPNATVTGTSSRPYEIGVLEPISYLVPARDGHGVGMSLRGASRWGYGNLGYQGNLDDWSVSWPHFEQILFHYYTGVHLRNADNNNTLLSPAYRWNPLSVDWGSGDRHPGAMQAGSSYYSQIQIQNTGVNTWNSSVKLGCELVGLNGVAMTCPDVTMGTVAPGDTVTKTLSIPVGVGMPDGPYRLKIDLKNTSGWFRNLEASTGRPWYSLNYTVCVGACRMYVPGALKNWPKTYFFETFTSFDPNYSDWIFAGTKDVGAPGRTDGYSLRLYEGASGSITVSIPPNSTVVLTYWCKDDDLTSYSYPRFDLYLDGADTTPGYEANNLSCAGNWGDEPKRQIIDTTYTSDGQVAIKFKAASLPVLNTQLRFDDIWVQSE